MMTAYLSVATTGMFDFYQYARPSDQPRLIRVAWVLADPDTSTIAEERAILTRPPLDVPVSPQAFSLHGITSFDAHRHPTLIFDALPDIRGALDRATAVCGYALQIPQAIIGREFWAAGLHEPDWPPVKIDLMKMATPIMKVPRHGTNGYAFPKLIAAGVFFDEPAPDRIGHDFAEHGLNEARHLYRLHRKIIDWIAEHPQASRS